MADMKYGYTLNLSEEEMIFIRDVLTLVGGDPINSRRRIADQILETLYQDKSLAWTGNVEDVKQDKKTNMYSCIWFTTKDGEV